MQKRVFLMNFISIKNIENTRKTLGISIAKLCVNTRINESTYHRWKSNQIKPSGKSLEKINKFFKKSFDNAK